MEHTKRPQKYFDIVAAGHLYPPAMETMCKARKDLMCCKHETSCDICDVDCRRAEIAPKELEIKTALLALLKDILTWDGILPHSKTRIKAAIASAERSEREQSE